MTTLYGIKNCSTVKKACVWLEEHGIEYQFHDFKKQGLEAEKLDEWLAGPGWEMLLNKRGTTWRNLPTEHKTDVGETEARALMLENTSIIKRPVIEYANGYLVGFDIIAYAKAFDITK